MSYKALIIGGSAGSFQVIVQLLSHLPENYPLPILLSLHRLKHVRNGFVEALSIKSKIKIIEPHDKEIIKAGVAYLAPANYHMLVDLDRRISLSIGPQVNHSRPSIDLSFQTAAESYRDKLVGVILSGANKDGAYGLKKVGDYGGFTIVQDPKEAQISTMPTSALNLFNPNKIFTVNQISDFINQLK
ncbi:MAG: chemotaxis protein CheB [Bacteroidales bacterium]|nr:chemotaxis protein CheB [Bacteroidales bacterium]